MAVAGMPYTSGVLARAGVRGGENGVEEADCVEAVR